VLQNREIFLSQCQRCTLDLNLYGAHTNVCPNCGFPVEENRSNFENALSPEKSTSASFELIGQFWVTVRDVIFSPSRFFSRHTPMLLSEGSVSSALAFAVIIQWLSAFFNFLWRSTAGIMLESRVEDLFKIVGDVVERQSGPSYNLDQFREAMVEFFFGAGAIVITPFLSLIKLVIFSGLVHIAVRFVMNEAQGRPHRYSTTLKVLAFASAPWILCILPGFGFILAIVLSFICAVIGLREVYQSTTFRSAVAVVFPEWIVLALLFAALLLLFFIAFNFLRLVF
jgi:ribosomal protein L37E